MGEGGEETVSHMNSHHFLEKVTLWAVWWIGNRTLKVHDTHSEAIIKPLILFSPYPHFLYWSSYQRVPEKEGKKSFKGTSLSCMAQYHTRPSLHPPSLFHAGVENHSIIMRQKNAKIGTKASKPSRLDTTSFLGVVSFCSVLCALLIKFLKYFIHKNTFQRYHRHYKLCTTLFFFPPPPFPIPSLPQKIWRGI